MEQMEHISEEDFRDFWTERPAISLVRFLSGTGVPYTPFYRWLNGLSGGRYPTGAAQRNLARQARKYGLVEK
jgi:hypothetical protein